VIRRKIFRSKNTSSTAGNTQAANVVPPDTSHDSSAQDAAKKATEAKREETRRKNLNRQIWQQVLGLAEYLHRPLISIVPALLYLKMRQLAVRL